jgi:hypothetical protein
MKRILVLFVLAILNVALFAQGPKNSPSNKVTITKNTGTSTTRKFPSNKKLDFSGQWHGHFRDNSSGFANFNDNSIDYILELECDGHLVTGYSYTYFYENNKRYYTICKLTGTINTSTKELTITEYERTKFNTPTDFGNCFQIHKLKYEKIGSDSEQLSGRWYPAPDQKGDCGFGTSILGRRLFKKNSLQNTHILSNNKKDVAIKDYNKQKNTSGDHKTNPNFLPLDKPKDLKKDTVAIADTLLHLKDPDRQKNKEMAIYEKRTNTVEKSIDLENETVTIDLYDNGEVDGDSISVFFNGQLIVSHLMITEKPATFMLNIDKNRPYNELIMYAENMGTIPPNTALMVVKDGDKRYDVHITSDTERNGTIYFHYKKPKVKPGN